MSALRQPMLARSGFLPDGDGYRYELRWGFSFAAGASFVSAAGAAETSLDVAPQRGPVRVIINVRVTTTTLGTRKTITRRMYNLSATYPTERPRSQIINEQAIPYLKSEALKAQSARIYVVSGATLTSDAFAQSLQAALLTGHVK